MQLVSARVAQTDAPAPEAAGDRHRDSERVLDLDRELLEHPLGVARAAAGLGRLVGLHPGLRLPDREAASEYDLEAAFLGRLVGESGQRAGMAGAERACGQRRLHRGAGLQESESLGD